MTAGQFWEEDPWLAAAYRQANLLNSQRRSEEMWLQGLYNYNAFAAIVGNALGRKGHKPLRYMEEPIRLTPMTEAEREARAEQERQRTIAYFNKLAKQWGINEL